MDSVSNVAKQQQSQMGQQESQSVRVAQTREAEQPKEANVVKEMQQENVKNSQKMDSGEQVQELVDQLNKALAPLTTNIKFGVDFQDIFYVSVIESETSKMIRRFPAEDAVGFLPKMKEVSGILFDSKG